MVTIFINRIWCVKVDSFVGNWSKRRQTETSTTKTSTTRNTDIPKCRQTKTKAATNQNVDIPKHQQTKASTDRNVDRPKRRQTKLNQNVEIPKHRPTKNVDIQNVDRPKPIMIRWVEAFTHYLMNCDYIHGQRIVVKMPHIRRTHIWMFKSNSHLKSYHIIWGHDE